MDQPLAAVTPRISIILGVRDHWERTFETLVALVEATSGLSTETIVVDDGSTDETAVALPRLPGITAVRAEAPQGLVAARRQGAALARGGLLVFLGNGATPRTGWLSGLQAAFDEDPGLAAATAAGVPLGSDGLAVRAEAYRAVHGLDPAYRERLAELDLLYRLEQAGLRHRPFEALLLEVANPWAAGATPSPGDEVLFASRWRERLVGDRPAAGDGGATRVEGGRGPRFSVLVPCYNQAHFLGAALDSLLAQSHGDWEALVVDDGSTDQTTTVASAYARRDPRIRPFRKENGGVASALNRGVAESRGEWICWLSSDDLFRPEKLAAHQAIIQADPSLRYMHTDFEVLLDHTGQRHPSGIDQGTFIPPPADQVIRFLQINYVNGITVAVHRQVFEELGGFDERFRYGQDYDLWLRIHARYRSRYLGQPTAVTRVHRGQGTALFSEAGIYDSARAAAAFMARHPFAALFPALDLSRPDHALHAAVAALQVAVFPHAFVTRCGFAGVLLDRCREWLAGAPDDVRALVQRELALAVARPDTEPGVAATLRPLLEVGAGAFAFEPVDPLALLQRHALRLEARGDAKELAALIRYLRMISDQRSRGLEARAP